MDSWKRSDDAHIQAPAGVNRSGSIPDGGIFIFLLITLEGRNDMNAKSFELEMRKHGFVTNNVDGFNVAFTKPVVFKDEAAWLVVAPESWFVDSPCTVTLFDEDFSKKLCSPESFDSVEDAFEFYC